MAGLINRIDAQLTVTATGNTDPLDTSGMGQVSFSSVVSAISGTGASVQVELEASDDATNWNTVHTTRQMTAVDNQRLSGVRVSAKYYRYLWRVLGTSPSADIKITTTLKDYSPSRTGSLFRYSDLDLKNGSAESATFSAFTNSEVGCMIVRPSDTSGVATLKIQGSNDNLNWHDQTGDFTIASGQSINQEFSGNSHRFMKVVMVTAATGGTTSVAHCLWNSTGGA